MRYLGFLLVSGLLISSARGQPFVPPPVGPPNISQQIKTVHEWSADKGTVSLVAEQVEYQQVQQEVNEVVIENGVQKTVKKPVTVTKAVLKKVVTPFVLKEGKATDVNGKPLSADEMFQRLPVGSAVLVLPAGYQLPNSHKRLFSKEAVILIPPAPSGR